MHHILFQIQPAAHEVLRQAVEHDALHRADRKHDRKHQLDRAGGRIHQVIQPPDNALGVHHKDDHAHHIGDRGKDRVDGKVGHHRPEDTVLVGLVAHHDGRIQLQDVRRGACKDDDDEFHHDQPEGHMHLFMEDLQKLAEAVEQVRKPCRLEDQNANGGHGIVVGFLGGGAVGKQP